MNCVFKRKKLDIFYIIQSVGEEHLWWGYPADGSQNTKGWYPIMEVKKGCSIAYANTFKKAWKIACKSPDPVMEIIRSFRKKGKRWKQTFTVSK